MNLLAALPEWFTSWGWIAIVAALAVIAVIVIVLIVLAKKRGKTAPAESEADAAVEEYPDDGAIVDEGKDDGTDAEVTEPEDEPENAAEEETSAPAAAEARPAADKKAAGNKTYHISKRRDENRWQVKIAGGAKAIKLFNTQYEAIDFAKKLAENQEAKIVIHKEDGTFRRLTYHKKKQ